MISFREFEGRARSVFESIPAHFRERVLGLVVERDIREHGELAGNYVLGECVHVPDWTEGDALRSTVHIYYGSFVRLAREDPDFDLVLELEETVLHEVQHHIEDSAGHGGLVDQDWAGEQNELRRTGRPHAPRFWRQGQRCQGEAHPTWAVDYDLFQELCLAPDAWDAASRDGLRLEAAGRKVVVDPGVLGESPALLSFEGYGRTVHGSGPGDLIVELRRRRSLLSRLNPFSRSG